MDAPRGCGAGRWQHGGNGNEDGRAQSRSQRDGVPGQGRVCGLLAYPHRLNASPHQWHLRVNGTERMGCPVADAPSSRLMPPCCKSGASHVGD